MKKIIACGIALALAVLVTGSQVFAHGWGDGGTNVERKVTQLKDGIRIEITSKDPTILKQLQARARFTEEYGFGPGMMGSGLGCPMMMNGW